MKWKCTIIGGLAFFLVTNLLGFFTGPVIHNGLLQADYRANAAFWVPELNEDPPDMVALMPAWFAESLILSLVVGWLYCRCSYGDGSGWKRGLGFGFGLGIFLCATYLGWSSVFDLPAKIWLYWGAEVLLMYAVGGAAMGWAAARWD
jgi:hypothetical protein